MREVAPDGVRLGGTAGEHAGALAGDQRPHAAGALRHDGDWHGACRIRTAASACRAASARRCRASRCSWSARTAKPVAPGTPGEIEVRGPTVFTEYWGKPDATRDAFRDGWFRTGDTAVVENGVYRILGRTNIDILKTGGHKVSALEIEEALREHPAIAECAVVGVPDPEWGERVAAAVVLNDGDTLDLPSLRTWARELLAAHKLPSRLLVLEALPRNAMGKVMKPAVAALFEDCDGSDDARTA